MPSLLRDYDLRSGSGNGKSISKRKPSEPVENLADKKRSISSKRDPRPRARLSYTYNGLCDEKTSHKCALAALSSLNEKSRAEQGPKYLLIEPLGCVEFRFSGLYHCNFIAKPRKGIDAENKLCFAEVQSEFKSVGVGMRTVYTCRFACVLGPTGSEMGLNGCTICDHLPDYIQHPEHGFTKIVCQQAPGTHI